MLKFTLGWLLSQTDRFGAVEELRETLLERARRGEPDIEIHAHDRQRQAVNTEVEKLERQLAAAQRNLAIEEDLDLRQAIRDEYRRLKDELEQAQRQLAALSVQNSISQRRSPEEEVEAALDLLEEIRRVATNPSAREEVLPLLQKLGLRIGLCFADGIIRPHRSGVSR